MKKSTLVLSSALFLLGCQVASPTSKPIIDGEKIDSNINKADIIIGVRSSTFGTPTPSATQTPKVLPAGDYLDYSGQDWSNQTLGLDDGSIENGLGEEEWIGKSKFIGTNFSNTVFYNIGVTNSDFTGANLSGFSLKGNYRIQWSGNDFTNANLTNSDFSTLTVSFNGSTPVYSPALSSSTITGATLTGANFYTVDFTGFKGYNGITNDFTGFNFTGATLNNTTFKNSNLSSVNFTSANLAAANFTGATLTGATLNHTTWSDGTICNSSSVGSCTDYDGYETASSNLLLNLKMNGNTNDSSGKGYNATSKNGPVLTSDRIGQSSKAYSFDGVDDYLEVPTVFSTAPTQFTVEAWVKRTGTTGGNIFYHGDNAEFNIASTSTGTSFNIRPANSDWIGVFTGGLSSTDWSQVVAVWKKGDSMKIYVNGVLKATTSLAGKDLYLHDPGTSFGASVGVYNRSASANHFPGIVDNIKVYNTALSDSQISAMYSNAL